MRITVIRHAKVNYIFPKKCGPEGALHAFSQYDRAPIIEKDIDPIQTQDNIFVSTLERSKRTAELIFGKRSFVRSSLFNEVKITPFTRRNVRLHSYTWDVVGRLCWLFRKGGQLEYRKETRKRADQAIDLIESYGDDAYVISHAFFMHTLFRQLKKRGYKGPPRGFHIKNLQSYEYIK